MANTRRDLRAELNRRLSWEEYSMASEYLNEAVGYSDQALREDTVDYDSRIHDFLICAKALYMNKGEYACARIMEEYARYF